MDSQEIAALEHQLAAKDQLLERCRAKVAAWQAKCAELRKSADKALAKE